MEGWVREPCLCAGHGYENRFMTHIRVIINLLGNYKEFSCDLKKRTTQ
jgi:hypothetical protein